MNDKQATPTIFKPTKEDYQKVYNDIASHMEDDDYDDGSYGPVDIPPLFSLLTSPLIALRLPFPSFRSG